MSSLSQQSQPPHLQNPNTINRSTYKKTADQLEYDDAQLDKQIDGFLLSEKLQSDEAANNAMLADDLNEEEEEYLNYLESKLKSTEHRILETQSLVNNAIRRDDVELASVAQLNATIDALIASKSSANARLVTQNTAEDLHVYVLRLQEENKRLLSERDDFELKYLQRNKQIQILIRQIKLHKTADKQFNSIIAQKESQLKRATQKNEMLTRIEEIERNRSRNIVQLPKMDSTPLIQKKAQSSVTQQQQPFTTHLSHPINDPFNFWSQHDTQSGGVGGGTYVSTSKPPPYKQNDAEKSKAQPRTLKDILPNQELWVVEQEKGAKRIDGLAPGKTYTEAPDTLYGMPHRISQSSQSKNKYNQYGNSGEIDDGYDQGGNAGYSDFYRPNSQNTNPNNINNNNNENYYL